MPKPSPKQMPKKTPKPKPNKGVKADADRIYRGISERATTRNLAASRSARDIGDVPPVVDRERRDRAAGSLLAFLGEYFPGTFAKPWSDDHRAVIERLQGVITDGGQYAIAAPRGAGKTSIVERAALWAVLTGRRRFVVIVAANESLAVRCLNRLKSELEYNPRLLADFPRETYPIRRLESQGRRCVGQLYNGERTATVWQKKLLVLPTMPGPDADGSGAVLYVAGITGAIRGLSHVDAEGRTIRPDLLLLDDPADREAARSATQTSERLSLANGDLLGLAGPGEKIAAVATCTIIFRHDFADRLLDNAVSPAWTGETYRLVYEWPDRADLWEQYLELRAEGFKPRGDRGLAATEFYASNRADMDAGAKVAWAERFEPGEISAIQNAFNLRQDRGEDVFMSEYQNDPIDSARALGSLDAAAVAARVGGFERGVAPPEVEKITAFIDIGQYVMWYVVCGWDDAFGCYVLDWGAWPEQRSRVFLARNVSPTLGEFYPKAGGEQGVVHAGLTSLVERIVPRDWSRSDGSTLTVSRLLIDAGWATDVVRLFIRQSPYREKLTPSKGVGLGPAQTAISDYRKRLGEKLGDGWVLGVAGPDRLRLCRFDSNFQKSRVAGMLTRPPGVKGGVELFGDKPADHELLALHLTSEYPTRTEAKGNTVDVWGRFPDRDNHMWDCLIGNAVAASLEGLNPLAALGGGTTTAGPRKRVSFAEMQRGKRP